MRRVTKYSLLLLAVAAIIPVNGLAGNETEVLPGWYYQTPTNCKLSDILMAVDALSETIVYFGGARFDVASMTEMDIRGLAYRSQDAGKTAQDLSGVLGAGGGLLGGKMCTMTDLKVWRGSASPKPVLWAACGEFLGRSSEGGAFDGTFDAPIVSGEDKDMFLSLHVVNGSTGFVGAASGNIYKFKLSEDGKTVEFTPTEIDNTPSAVHATARPEISAMYWLNSRTGWAVANDAEDVDQDDGQGMSSTVNFYYQTRIFKTTDGGDTWTLQGAIDLPSEDPVHMTSFGGKEYPMSFTGGWMPRHVQFVDETTGFLGLVAWDQEKQHSVVAKILKTTDGGKTWNDLAANMQIGTINQMIMTTPILLSELAGMYFWKDAEGIIRGHIFGSSYITETSSGGGSPTLFFNVTAMDTTDGGATWTKKPELGDMQMDMQGGGTVPSTPRAMAATWLNPYAGYAVGDKGTVFRFKHKCTMQSQCEFGYFCHNKQLECLSCSEIGTTDHAGSIAKCEGWTPPPEPDPELIDDRDAIDPGDSNVNYPDGTTGMDLNGFDPGAKSGGCSAGYGDQSVAAVALMIILASITFVIRRRQTAGKL